VITKPVVTAPPQELPKTGLGEDILKVTGVGSIIAAVGYYAASRRNLLNAFLSR
jgi:LPXTG-motif cell wall-anchored protein